MVIPMPTFVLLAMARPLPLPVVLGLLAGGGEETFEVGLEGTEPEAGGEVRLAIELEAPELPLEPALPLLIALVGTGLAVRIGRLVNAIGPDAVVTSESEPPCTAVSVQNAEPETNAH